MESVTAAWDCFRRYMWSDQVPGGGNFPTSFIKHRPLSRNIAVLNEPVWSSKTSAGAGRYSLIQTNKVFLDCCWRSLYNKLIIDIIPTSWIAARYVGKEVINDEEVVPSSGAVGNNFPIFLNRRKVYALYIFSHTFLRFYRQKIK